MIHWIATRLRYLADRIDRDGAPKAIGWTFTFETGVGIVFRQDGRGARLWYLDDYDKAHTESDSNTPDRPGYWIYPAEHSGDPAVRDLLWRSIRQVWPRNGSA